MERKRIEVLVETFIQKTTGLKAHTVTRVEETEEYMIIHIDRLGTRLLRCGLCRQRCRKVHSLGMARPVHAEIAMETALPAPSSGMPQVRRTSRGLSVGGTVGARHHGTVQCRGETGTGVELAGDGAAVRAELKKCGHECEADVEVRVGKPTTTARACHLIRRRPQRQRLSPPTGGLR